MAKAKAKTKTEAKKAKVQAKFDEADAKGKPTLEDEASDLDRQRAEAAMSRTIRGY